MIQDVVFKHPASMPLYPTRAALSPPKRIIVHTDGVQLNPQMVSWNNKSILVGDMDLFILIIKDWMKRFSWSKSQALDEFFKM